MTNSEQTQPLVVELQDVTREHGRPGDDIYVKALRGINLTIRRGEYVAITGESGSGKTTLLHLLGALDSPTHGRIMLNGNALETANSGERAAIRARLVGIVFQGANLIESLNALENVLLAAWYARAPRTQARAQALALLAQVGLADRMYHFPAQLSGGQRQRVAIARALINQPAILLADEPTGELDTRTADHVLDVFDHFHRQLGQTLIIVTHNPGVWQRAQRVIRLADGEIMEDSAA